MYIYASPGAPEDQAATIAAAASPAATAPGLAAAGLPAAGRAGGGGGEIDPPDDSHAYVVCHYLNYGVHANMLYTYI